MLENLEPKTVWKYFEQFCSVPHPSGHEQEAAEYIRSIATKLGLDHISDAAGNVLIRKESADRNADRPTVILQSHLDMVAQKNETFSHDFLKDPIRPYIDGEWVRARGTTLGADNGIGVAIACAVLESATINHGPIEALFTVDEERGMTGAFGLAKDSLKGRKLINLDTENEHEICIGCAGGTDVIATLPVKRELATDKRTALSLTLNGLLGGHSGMEIHLGRGNALKLMARMLTELSRSHEIHLHMLNGGSARNAIPRESFATISVPDAQACHVIDSITSMRSTLKREFETSDPALNLQVLPTVSDIDALDTESFTRILEALFLCPYGIIEMSETIPDEVQTSNNLAIVNPSDNTFIIDCMLRSSSQRSLASLKESVSGLFASRGASITYGSIYPGWLPVPDSELLKTMKQAYSSVHNSEPAIVAVHAGLECGIIGAKFDGMQMISCGPTIRFAHSPDEQMNIPSVERFYRSLIAGLEMI